MLEHAVEVTLIHEEALDPLLEMRLPPPIPAGIHAVDLAIHGIRLEVGKRYRWFVSVVVDPRQRSRDIVSSAWIRRTDRDASALTRRARADPEGAARMYAHEGLWYDALESASRLACERGDDRALQALLARIDRDGYAGASPARGALTGAE